MSLVKGFVSAENVDKICKICLEEKHNMVNSKSRIEFKELSQAPIPISDVLCKVISQEMMSNQPILICHDCIHELKAAYFFILKYEEATGILQQFMVNYMKTEPETEFSGKRRDPEVGYETRSTTRRLQNKKQVRKRRLKEEEEEEEDQSSSNYLYPCPICTKEFPALELRDHAHTHKALKKYLRIPVENRVSPTAKFCTKRHLEKENVTLFQREVKRHKCPYCLEEFDVQAFRIHVEVHRKQSEFKCDKCDRIFKQLNHLNTHRVKHMKEVPYKCEQCGKGFVIKNNYDCHILTHTNNELPHECRFCLKRFSNPEHLNRHQIIHTENVTYSVKYRVCRCHHCLRTFKDKDELKGHVCSPVEQLLKSRYSCKQCKKVFKHASGLYNHKRNIHMEKGAKILCSVCGLYVSNIYNHMMRHTGEKPYQCNQCEKRFIAKPQLKQHLLVHSGLKPFVCSVCAKAFNNLYNLQVHERIHKGDRCHICPICNKGFLEKSYLKKHMNVHSKL